MGCAISSHHEGSSTCAIAPTTKLQQSTNTNSNHTDQYVVNNNIVVVNNNHDNIYEVIGAATAALSAKEEGEGEDHRNHSRSEGSGASTPSRPMPLLVSSSTTTSPTNQSPPHNNTRKKGNTRSSRGNVYREKIEFKSIFTKQERDEFERRRASQNRRVHMLENAMQRPSSRRPPPLINIDSQTSPSQVMIYSESCSSSASHDGPKCDKFGSPSFAFFRPLGGGGGEGSESPNVGVIQLELPPSHNNYWEGASSGDGMSGTPLSPYVIQSDYESSFENAAISNPPKEAQRNSSLIISGKFKSSVRT